MNYTYKYPIQMYNDMYTGPSTPSPDYMRMVRYRELIFQLIVDYDINPQVDWNSTSEKLNYIYWHHYYCLDCKRYMDVDWFTRSFKQSKELKEIPENVQEEMNRHAINHSIMESLGVKAYKEFNK